MNAKILLPRGDKMVRGQVVVGNIMPMTTRLSNQNHILDSHLYEVKFAGGKTTELVTNIIIEQIHAWCDVIGDKYLSLEAFIDHRKNDSALSAGGQKEIVKGKKTLRKSAAGWDICCKWKDIYRSWENFSNLKML